MPSERDVLFLGLPVGGTRFHVCRSRVPTRQTPLPSLFPTSSTQRREDLVWDFRPPILGPSSPLRVNSPSFKDRTNLSSSLTSVPPKCLLLLAL